MAEVQRLILHHYPTSPFAEKIRLIMGSKGMHWSSVLVAEGGDPGVSDR